MNTFVLVHLSSIDAFADICGQKDAATLARRLTKAINKHRGTVVIVDQFWDGPIRDHVVSNITRDDVAWLEFDEDTQSWDVFFEELHELLANLNTRSVTVGGFWFDPGLESGCASAVFVDLREIYTTRVDSLLVGRECW